MSAPSNGESATALCLPGHVPHAGQESATVVENERIATDTYRMRVQSPHIASTIQPGQFFMVRAPDHTDPLLGRPFALYDVYDDSSGTAAGVDFVYLVIGKLTDAMTRWRPGDPVELWGPLGNGFPQLTTVNHLALVAGGIGQTPFLAVAAEALGHRQYGREHTTSSRPRVTLCYGARSADYLAGLDDFAMDGLDIRLATDDGSRGHHGFVTDVLQELLVGSEPPDAILCCGPEPMMEAVAGLAATHETDCWLSLETPMACGFGVCFSCVTKVKTPTGWDYQRTCVEGPIFRADALHFDE